MSINKVILVGRLGRDPETRYMPNGDAVCNFSIATDETWKDAQGQRQSRTEWHNITIYRKLAEIAGQYLKKGSLVYLEGKIQSRKYQGKDGIERTAYDIIANEMKMLGGRNDTSEASSFSSNTPSAYQSNEPSSFNGYEKASNIPSPHDAPPPPRKQAPPQAPVNQINEIDDDIPF